MPPLSKLKRRAFLLLFRWKIQCKYLWLANQAPMRRLLRRKGYKTTIFAVWGTGVGIGIASYTAPVPTALFTLSYILLAGSTLWAVGAILIGKRCNIVFRIIGAAVALAVGIYCIGLVRQTQVGREMLLLKGILMPANDPDPWVSCSSQIPDNALRFYFKGAAYVVDGSRLNIVYSEEKHQPLLGIERNADGTLTLVAHLIDQDGKQFVNIDKNTFEINRNRLFDSLSPPRPDASTIRVKDEYGNELTIRYVNKHAFSFRGIVFFRPPDGYVRIDDNGLTLMPNNNQLEVVGNSCIHVGGPGGEGRMVVIQP